MLRRGALLAVLASLVLAWPASAGRLVESGHDFEWHCVTEGRQCHFVKVALDYVRAGAPSPTKPVLVLDHDPNPNDAVAPMVAAAIDKTFGTGKVHFIVVDPRTMTATSPVIDTAHWSAIFVASDITCGGI